ncbi:hypothetical protein [Caballeronia sp. DA-9]|uniref:hypothetical protein n=1 Tax=Caballeronia sp. DA-9 TaxID=3436237 RepID=UPI003F676A2E
MKLVWNLMVFDGFLSQLFGPTQLLFQSQWPGDVRRVPRSSASKSGHRGIHAALLKKCAKPAPAQPLGSAIVLQWWLFFDLSFHA